MRSLIAGILGLGLFLAPQTGANTVTQDQPWHYLVRTVLEAPWQAERQRQDTGQMVAEREPEAVREVGSQVGGGLQITLLLSGPKGQREMQEMMAQMGMGGMKGMDGMKGMEGMKGMPMEGMPMEPPTHYIGVIIRDARTKRVMPGLTVTLTARAPSFERKVPLWGMAGSYANNIALPAGRRYEVRLRVEPAPATGGQPREATFTLQP